MIRHIASSLPTFKTIKFGERLNIVLAEKTVDGRTRNGAGKSSIVEVIHFALGARAGVTSLFRTPTLNDVEFIAHLDIDGQERTIRRIGNSPNVIYAAPTSGLLANGLTQTKKCPIPHFPLLVWQTLLGEAFFSLPTAIEESENVESSPSFRSLITYFVRRVHDGGIDKPYRSNRSQQTWNIQVNLSYLFGLDYRLPSILESVRKRERQLKEFKVAAKSGALGILLRRSAQIRPELVSSESRLRSLEADLKSFVIHDFYKESVQRSAQLSKELRSLSDENLIDADALLRLNEALASELDVDHDSVAALYSELADLLPGAVQKRLDQVVEFHRSVVGNRRRSLQDERNAVLLRVSARDKRIQMLDAARSALLLSLKGAGALDDFVALQAAFAEEQQNVRALRFDYDKALMVEGGSTNLELERKEIEKRIRRDHYDRGTSLEHAALVVRELVSCLYNERVGNLLIEVTDNGPIFKIEIDGDRSEGISRMEIWCFDMLLGRLCAERGIGPGFVVHDSHIFDGVDSRQIAAALEKGLEYSKLYKFQYIVLLNSDVFERLDVSAEVKKAVVDVQLTDRREDGGLFGCIIYEREGEGIAEDEYDEDYDQPSLF